MSCSWQPPEGSAPAPLMVHNTLVGDKVPFVPSGGPGSKQVTWYTCGPTVYDTAHLGHAKNYVAGDVVRRVLEDYFGYDVLFVMNVTDVEDKIVYRARRNYLLKQYADAATNASKVAEDIRAALAYCTAKQALKLQEVQQAALELGQAAGAARQRDALEEAIADERKKAENLVDAGQRFETAVGEGASAQRLLEVAGDVLADHLDSQHGAEVTDLSIFREHAARYEAEFLEDLDSLGCRPPDVLTRVSEYIPEIVEFIEKIIGNGMAYEASGSVYFDTNAFSSSGHEYGKLNPSAVASSAASASSAALLSGEALTGDKRAAADFALWKAAKAGEPYWDSPWGKGRPGWHIECSAMASSIIGQKLDLHSGGEDLRFPHHTNELAQSEAYYHCEGCQQWCNYFLHMGHLSIEGLKMSKSLKNFITIREALQDFTPRQLRLMFVLTPWDRKMNFGKQLAGEVAAKEALLRNFFGNCEVAQREHPVAAGPTKWEAAEIELNRAISEQQSRVHAALADNINTGAAMDALCDLIKAVNLYLADRSKTSAAGGARPQSYLLRKATRYASFILSCFGIVEPSHDRPGLRGGGGGGAGEADGASSAGGAGEAYLNTLAAFRDEVRALAKNKAPGSDILACCDRLRDEGLVDLGVQLEDRPDGKALWKLEDPQLLREAQRQRAAEAAAAKLKKVANTLTAKSKDLDKFEALAALPSYQQALGDKYSKFDEATGDPTHDKDGVALEGKALDKAKKEVEKQRKVRAPLAKKLAEDPTFLDKLRSEVQELQRQRQALEELEALSLNGGGA